MRRRQFITLLGGVAAAWPHGAGAQQQTAVAVVGFLAARGIDSNSSVAGPFRQGMSELGYIEGQNFTIEERYGDGQYERLPSLAEQLVKLKVDVIVAVGSPAVRAAQQASATIPIVIGVTGDAVQSGLVASLARPGGNTTGLSNLISDITTKHLQLIMMLRPDLTRLTVFVNPGSSSRTPVLKRLEEAGTVAGVTVMPVDAGTPQEVERGLTWIKRERAEGLIVVADAFMFSQLRRIADFAIENRLPSIYEYREYPDAGGLIGYGASNKENLRRAAAFVAKILKGAKPADLPIEQSTKFELIINLKTAKALGVGIPEKLLFTADEVIE